MNLSKIFASIQAKALAIAFGFSFLVAASPASAHHPMGGKIPSNFFEGFLSGLAHPVIGIDHLAFIVTIGLFAATKSQGIFIPLAFVLSAMLGTGIHLLGASLPVVELIVSTSILLFGILLAIKNSPNLLVMISLSSVAGLFHGYAYGEAIFGAQTTALVAYLAGFTVIQLVISSTAFFIGQKILKGDFGQVYPNLRSAGLVICGIGAAFLASNISSLILPVPKG
jgi:urease accessory protein